MEAFQSWEMSTQYGICIALIALFGIPHGALDHLVLDKSREAWSIVKFIGVYVIIIGLYTLVWVLFPKLSMIFFLLLSAYHFGQSQFSSYHLPSMSEEKLIYLTWGVSILAGLLVYNAEELEIIATISPELGFFVSPIWLQVSQILLILSTTVWLVLFGIEMKKNSGFNQKFLIEIIVFALIHLSFYVFPTLFGFSLYFIVLHSGKVMQEIYDYLSRKKIMKGMGEYVKATIPFTVMSWLGIAGLFLLVKLGFLNIGMTLLSFIIISTITLPHAMVMEMWYNRRKAEGLA